MKYSKKILLGLVSVLALAAAGFVIWAETPYRPESPALAAMESNAGVTVGRGSFTTFAPVGVQPTTGFVFYPGARVDERSYAAPLREIAARGYLVVLLSVRLNLAMFDVNAAQGVFKQYPQIKHWAVGGHSLGGVAAAMFVKEHIEQVQGIIFWGSYPADDSLKTSALKVLSIYGTNDLGGIAKFQETRARLPPSTKFVVIEGGNHAQFGDYGEQRGDSPATISRTEQQAQTVAAVTAFLNSLGQ